MRRGACILALVAACGKPYSADIPPDDVVVVDAGSEAGDPTTGGPTPLPDGATPLPECGAQRVVHLVGGGGGLAWFTLVWPLPDVIESYTAEFAYDDPSHAVLVGNDPDHPLYARVTRSHATFNATGTSPNPSAFIIGSNQTHTSIPNTMVTKEGENVLAVGAAAQIAALAPKIPVLKIGNQCGYSHAANEPAPTEVADPDAAIAALKNFGVPGTAITPEPEQVDDWAGTSSNVHQKDLAHVLAFAALAFRTGSVGTIITGAFDDDPHGAFNSSAAASGGDQLAYMLDQFFVELRKYDEPNCGHLGAPLSLADNVVLVISGDTPKNSFAKTGWGDATANGTNFVYVRSNGFTKPGWFGKITADNTFTPFNASTGSNQIGADRVTSTDGALTALLYAITRGNKVAVAAASKSAYAGIISP